MQREPLIIVGATGLIGSGLKREALRSEPTRPVIAIRHGSAERLAADLRIALDRDPARVVFASGLTDPSLPEDELQEANLEIPRRVIEAFGADAQVRFLTLGSAMENFSEACAANPYLRSKRDLSQWIERTSQEPRFFGRLRHVRLHTVYGGEARHLKRHMFLGHVYTALKNRAPFEMSSGEQLREYHHVDRVARALIHSLFDPNQWSPNDPSVFTLSSGQPVRLADLARAIFHELGTPSQLRIGALAGATGENKQMKFPATALELLGSSQESVSGVIRWLDGLLK